MKAEKRANKPPKSIVFPEPALLTVRQARHALGGISAPTIYKLIAAEKLDSLRIGSRRLITPEAISRCIERLHSEQKCLPGTAISRRSVANSRNSD